MDADVDADTAPMHIPSHRYAALGKKNLPPRPKILFFLFFFAARQRCSGCEHMLRKSDAGAAVTIVHVVDKPARAPEN
jgi:hypothetical protein